MKFHEQPGYDPEDFSAAQAYQRDPEEAARLREASTIVVDPFVPPEYVVQPRKLHVEQRHDGDAEYELPDSGEAPTEELPTQEVSWIILPVGEGQVRGFGNGDGDGGAQIEDKPENIKKLEAYAFAWGNGSYRAVSKVEASDGTIYEVRVLPAIVGGLAVEHALADTGEGDNALFAWRAEKGFRDDEDDVTWRDVFSTDKKHAEVMGARRIYHNLTTYDRVEAYFARPVDELDKRF